MAEKDEHVLVGAITHRPGLTVIPTLTRLGSGTVKLYHYGSGAPNLSDLLDQAAKLRAEHGVGGARVIWFEPADAVPPAGADCVRLQLKTFGATEHPGTAVHQLQDLPAAVTATFAEFASQLAADGFAFLWDRFQAGALDGPILTVVADGVVAGAIGPMEIMKDSGGNPRLLPQYFGVLPRYRGHGFGRRLWRGAMHWGQRNRAAYQLLQTELDGSSDNLCRSEGLDNLGCVLTASP
jgi:GNAT superfamily N-acetyltransferase